MRIWVKICATTCVEDALASITAGADALGFVFTASPRQISANQAREIVQQVPAGIETIGVFRNEPVERVAQVVEETRLTGVQLHGEETAAFITEMKAMLPPQRKIRVIKTILVNDYFEERFAQVCAGADDIDSVLLDSGGGSGRTFDWQKAQPFLGQNRKPLILAGGLNASNIKEAIGLFTPWGVDVVSGVEREPGRKAPHKLRAFIQAIRETQHL
jgi:phosphoribosylanthranilate isomerase